MGEIQDNAITVKWRHALIIVEKDLSVLGNTHTCVRTHIHTHAKDYSTIKMLWLYNIVILKQDTIDGHIQ